MDVWVSIALAVVPAVAAAGGAWAAVRVEMRWLRRDLDEVRDIVGIKRLIRRSAN